MTNNYVYVLKSTVSMYDEPTIDGIFDSKEKLEMVMKELNIKKRKGREESEPEELYYTGEEANLDWDTWVKETYYFAHKLPLNYYDWYLDEDSTILTDLDI